MRRKFPVIGWSEVMDRSVGLWGRPAERKLLEKSPYSKVKAWRSILGRSSTLTKNYFRLGIWLISFSDVKNKFTALHKTALFHNPLHLFIVFVNQTPATVNLFTL